MRMKFLNTYFYQWFLVACLSTGLLSACQNTEQEPQTSQVQTPVSKNQQAASLAHFTVVTPRSPMTFKNSAHGIDGFEFQLLKSFASKHNYQLDIIVADTEHDVYQALAQGHANIALSGQPASSTRREQFRQSQAYMEVTTQLIYRHSTGKPLSFDDLTGKNIVVPNLEHYHEKYQFLKSQHPDIHFSFSDKSLEQLLQAVNNGQIDYTLAGSHEFLRQRSKYPRTRVAFDLYYPEPLSLSIGQNVSIKQFEQLNAFLDQALVDGTVAHLKERFLGHVDDINPRGSRTFFYRVDHRLPHYVDLIEKIAKKHGMDWRLLAAIAYQESHWNPNAKSPTGVRGMMMLTHNTAKELGVKNRLDLTESLNGGAKYFQKLYKRLPKAITEPDRSWLALASYNVGYGHVQDARKITEFQGGNPNRWADVKNYLPLLENKDWYQYTRFGHARGSEPVSYVQNIRHFNDLLQWRFPDKNRASGLNLKAGEQISIKAFSDFIKEAKAETAKDQEAASKLG